MKKGVVALLVTIMLFASTIVPMAKTVEDAQPLLAMPIETEVTEEIQFLLDMLYVEQLEENLFINNNIEEVLENHTDSHTVYFDSDTYKAFMDSLDQSFSGIGIYIEIVPEGVLVLSVMPNSPSEGVGLQPGDIIVKTDGINLAGLSNEEAVSHIRGPEGSVAKIEVVRKDEILNFDIVRTTIEVPSVEGEIENGNIGVISLHSFGSNTATDFMEIAKKLRNQGANSWIIDLRFNGGGYLQSALDIAGYFVGEETILLTKDERGNVGNYYSSNKQFFNDDKVIVLVNEFSASASEILTGAIKDYNRATIVGNTTFGKGSIQQIYPLSNGGALKLTTMRFFSPLENPIDGVGIKPHIVTEEESHNIAKLLLSGANEKESMNKRLNINNQWFNVDLELSQQEEFWPTYKIILNALGKKFSPESYFQSYRSLQSLEDVEEDKVFNVVFSGPINIRRALDENAIELIHVKTGQRIELENITASTRILDLQPKEKLEKGEVYWLLFHDHLLSMGGNRLRTPTFVEIKVQD